MIRAVEGAQTTEPPCGLPHALAVGESRASTGAGRIPSPRRTTQKSLWGSDGKDLWSVAIVAAGHGRGFRPGPRRCGGSRQSTSTVYYAGGEFHPARAAFRSAATP